MSETRVPMNGNLKALYDKMMERELNKDYKIDLYFSKTNQKNYYKTLMKHVKIAIKAAKADYIFIDDFCSFFKYINPSKNTQIIQLWHAGLGFKDVGYGRFGESGSPHPIYTPHHKNDYIVVGSQELQNIYAEVFQCDTDRCLPYGLPRLDNYLNENSIDTFKKDFYHKYPYLKNKKIILFAPTFRGNSPQTAYYPIDKLNQDKIADICGDDYVFVLKFHPYIKKKFIIDEKYQNIIFDLSDFSDINFLFYVTEILITDYSSAIYEFSLFEKPILFYAFDEIEYTLTRGIHHSYKDNTPGKICRTLDDIYEAIKNQDFELEKVLEFKKKYHHNSKENSTDLIIDNLILKNKT